MFCMFYLAHTRGTNNLFIANSPWKPFAHSGRTYYKLYSCVSHSYGSFGPHVICLMSFSGTTLAQITFFIANY
uniref:Secreted protein n=1 Tax=Macrostomum lignano TaxID=282301 RepID=A0A1I8FHA2_9PLAT